MASDLPTDFDFIVLGTGLPESILAAAFSRNGYKVLHLDRNNHYSDQWASFNLKGLENVCESQKDLTLIKEREGDKAEDDERLLTLSTVKSLVEDINIQYYVQEKVEPVYKELEDNLSDLNIKQSEVVTDDTESSLSKITAEDVRDQHSEQIASTSHTDGSSSVKHNTDSITSPIVNVDSLSSPIVNIDSITSPLQNLDSIEPTSDFEKSSEAKTDSVPVSKDTDSSIISTAERTLTNEVEINTETEVNISAKDTCIIDDVDLSLKYKKVWTKNEIQDKWRSFNIDLAPKVLYSSGKMVELLISSDVAKYCEFRTVSRVLTQNNAQIEKIPCSRADVFSSKEVSMLDKRKLMKFLEWCAGYHSDPDAYDEYKNQTFHDVLKSKNLSENLQNIIKNAIAMVTSKDLTQEGLEKTQLFLQSVGRYGNTPFLFPLYGSGELPQAFCRLCAVFGGIYCLSMSANSLVLDANNKCQAIITSEGQRINCKWLIMGSSYSPSEYRMPSDNKHISRCILLTDRSLLHKETQELSLLWIPPDDSAAHPISVLELPPSAMVCPKHMYVVHLTTERSCGPQSDFLPFIQQYFSVYSPTLNNEETCVKPNILWTAYFSQTSVGVNRNNLPDNIFILDGTDTKIDMDKPVVQAKKIFEQLCPDDDFLPKPPHPDDIIFVDENQATVGGGETWDSQKTEESTPPECGIDNKNGGVESGSKIEAEMTLNTNTVTDDPPIP